MSKNTDSNTTNYFRRKILQASTAGLIAGTTISISSSPISAQENETDERNESDGGETETSDQEEVENTEDDEQSTICAGSPSMSRTSVTTPNSRITSEDPAVVEANFRPDPMISDECAIMVDLEFSFTDSGFQWGGGAEWDQATSDLVVGQFEVRPGEIRDIRGELHTQGAEAGDSVTVVADYEIWFKGNPEESVQQSGIRHTIDVEEPNPAPENDDESTGDSVPGFGVLGTLAGIGGAAYVFKSKLIGSDE